MNVDITIDTNSDSNTGSNEGRRRPEHKSSGISRIRFCPFFESDTLFLEYVFVLCLVVSRFFESRDVYTVPSKSIIGIP